jgi:preprotein translocase subunit SecF
MSLQFPNIYTSKNLKLLLAIPVVLLLVGLYLTQYIQYDTSLKGGVQLLIQTNSTINPEQFASMIGTKLGVAPPTISASPGGYQITVIANTSLSDGESSLEDFYSYQANYSASQFNATTAQIGLSRDSGNSTLLSELKTAQSGMDISQEGMNRSLSLELFSLEPLIGQRRYNSSSVTNMASVASGAFTNASVAYQNKVIDAVRSILPFSSYSYQQISPTLSQYFLGQVIGIIIVAFILVSITVFIIFRTPVPAFAVVFGAGNDIIVALGAMALFKIPLGIASLGGLLMLIGFSMDTDMLAAIRILKRHEGTPEERAYNTMKTGVTMTTTALVSFAILFIVSVVAYVPTYYEISGVVLLGLIADILTTWFGNASMIMMYERKRERR